jgi:hypothetical protein
MSSILDNQFEINGVISTDKGVLQNLNDICTACGCWLTYDISLGKWAVIINRPGVSQASFNDSNIIGGINISGTGINELYNAVSIEYPHKDLDDAVDIIDLKIDSADRFPTELDNTLQMAVDIINNPIQAQFIAGIELKQSRLDKVIQFRTDYSKLGLKAGDLVDITSDVYGYTAKMFRITRIDEEDSETAITLAITAIEYDEAIYDTTDLSREARTKLTGIPAKINNRELINNDNQGGLKLELSESANLQGLALTYAGTSALKWVLDIRSRPVTIAATGVVITWSWDQASGGEDLDIRCRIVYPYVGQDTVQECIGFTGSTLNEPDPNFPVDSVRFWPPTGAPILGWGGDNQGAGEETVLIDINQFKTYFPSERYLIVECRGNWYTRPSPDPAILSAALYQGGTFAINGFTWTNSGATKRRNLGGLSVYVDSNEDGFTFPDPGTTTPGDLMGYFVFDTTTNTGQIWNYLPDEFQGVTPPL